MTPSSHERNKQHAFDSFCKKVLKHEARDHYDEMKRQREREVSFSELSAQEMEQLFTVDKYLATEQVFNVLGREVVVNNELIAEALRTLPERKRDIILLAYFLEMSDREIGETLMNSKTASNLLPYPVIVLAASGDVDAINAVLKHYEGYIAALSTKQLYDASGTPHLCVDEALRRRLETKLITKILTFKVA